MAQEYAGVQGVVDWQVDVRWLQNRRSYILLEKYFRCSPAYCFRSFVWINQVLASIKIPRVSACLIINGKLRRADDTDSLLDFVSVIL